jgi:hypothetical protein
METGELIEEAVERAGIDPASLTHRHLTSIKRSLSLLFTEIEKAIPGCEYRQVETTLAIDEDAGAIEMPADMIDVVDVMVIRSDGSELDTTRISRQDYLHYNRNQESGTPVAWWLSKSLPGEVDRLPDDLDDPTDNMILVLWPPNGLAGASLRISYVRQTTDPTTLGAAVDARREWLETLCRGLAAKVAEKFNPARERDLIAKYMASLADQNTDMHPVVMGFRGFGWSRGRRH